jgi:signal transduction histidine kinase
VPSRELKYFAGVSLIACGLVLLTVSLLRRQRHLAIEVARRSAAEDQLREANARLEARVQERTSHLHELIGGLEAFNRSVSHDLRGPLSGMSNLARMAADDLTRGDSALAQRALPLIAGQCDASVDMVNVMLELARLGDAPVQRQPVCLSDLARSAFEEVRLAHPQRPPPAVFVGRMPLVMADPRLLRTVFVNLIGNAVKFTRDTAAPRIDIEAGTEGRDVWVCVRDNGVGFSADAAEHLFEPFYRAHDKRFEGHGLGLSIVRRAVEALGGHAWAQSPAQGGAQLCFTLGDAAVDAAAPAAEPHSEREVVAS